jgi:hypothetical protein
MQTFSARYLRRRGLKARVSLQWALTDLDRLRRELGIEEKDFPTTVII